MIEIIARQDLFPFYYLYVAYKIYKRTVDFGGAQVNLETGSSFFAW